MGSAPAAVARGTPEGIKLEDGLSTLVTIGTETTIELWEQSVTPPGIEGGDAVDTTTMHNTVWRTMAPRQLKTLTEVSFTAMYDPHIYGDAVSSGILDWINVRTTITVTFPDGSTLAFYGYVKSFIPGDLVEGTPPEATVTIVPTNADPTDRSEQAPVLVEKEGT